MSEQPKKRREYKLTLVHRRSGRLTEEFWLLREGMVQNVMPRWRGSRKHGRFSYWDMRSIAALQNADYLTAVKGPRGGGVAIQNDKRWRHASSDR